MLASGSLNIGATIAPNTCIRGPVSYISNVHIDVEISATGSPLMCSRNYIAFRITSLGGRANV